VHSCIKRRRAPLLLVRDGRPTFQAFVSVKNRLECKLTPELLATISRYDSFPATASDLIEIVGLESAAKLIGAWPGQEADIPTRHSITTGRGRFMFDKLTSVIGEDAAWKIVDELCGCTLQIPNCKAVRYAYTQDVIRTKYDEMTSVGGMSSPVAVFELGIEFNLARRSIERILKRDSGAVHADAS